MLIKVRDFEYTECWDGVFYKALSNYPEITEWEIQSVLDFIAYEKKHGRSCTIEADSSILKAIEAFCSKENRKRIPVPAKITECTACPQYKGCLTNLVCHTSPLEKAIDILECGSLLSPVRARGLSASELKKESRNAANDPEDYFDYIMFAWGNCQAGDRLVTERRLGHSPTDKELSAGFTPGVRYFFHYDRLINHPDAVFDGVLPLKVRDEVVLKDWLYAMISPKEYKNVLEPHVPAELCKRTHYLHCDMEDIWSWSEKVYEFVINLKQ
ncbi:hypothetical protein [Ruminococcus sp. FC2018]|uniref:hypothetical protein n=1 Tax=Ruminococcus sp. FC2018 TaxID=1410617 RepID=UPI00048E6E7D|nr:hypothetical protein [Ruminococcus sp. FC2018]